ncbi:hypothetical protein ACFQ51_49960 [Streptomyces kaempferi]
MAGCAAQHGGLAGADLAAVAHELRLGRAALRCRLAVVAHTVTGLAAQLAAFAEPAGPGRTRRAYAAPTCATPVTRCCSTGSRRPAPTWPPCGREAASNS